MTLYADTTTTVGVVTTTSAPRQLSDGNGANGGPGTSLGQGPTDSLSFFGNVPVPQPGGNVLDAVTRGGNGGMVMTFASIQTPSSVATLTTAEQSVTVQSGTGAVLAPAVGDLIIVNKPTSQAGLGVGNARYSSANTIGVTFNNLSGGTLTPTAAQIYGVTVVRGLDTLTTVLTPASVVSNTTSEQLFTVAGLRVGNPVAVNKPTSQPGLDVVNARVSGDNQLGITYLNTTNGTLTPTATETYTIFATGGIEVTSGILTFAGSSTLTPATVATVTTADVTITTANITTTDTVVSVTKPTLQVGLGVVASRGAANRLSTTFVNPTGGTLTPTASEVYTATIIRPVPAAPVVIYNPVLTPASVAANTTAEQAFTVTGVPAASVVIVSKPSAQNGLGIVGARVSAANVIAITYCNPTSAAITPASETYAIGNIQLGIDTTAGNMLAQSGAPNDSGVVRLANGMQAALGTNTAAGGMGLLGFG